MKLLYLLTLLVGLAVAAELSELGERARRPHKQTHRPKKFSGSFTPRAAKRPSNAPDAYKTSMRSATRKRSKAPLKKLPANLIDPDTGRRRASRDALQLLRRQTTANDYYECVDASPEPVDADCNVIIDQVYASDDESLVLSSGTCLSFVYQTCEGYFCALCSTISTNTDFIGNQLDSAEDLCVAGGQDGSIIGEDAPEWDAGFVRSGDSLPTYDVC